MDAENPELAAVHDDPHASKISPDDPRLRIQPHASRQLRKGPALAIAIALACIVGASLVLAMTPHKRTAAATPIVQPVKPAVPDTILKAAGTPKARPNDNTKPALPAESEHATFGARNDFSPYSKAALQKKETEAFWAARSAGVLVPTGTIAEASEPASPSRLDEPRAASGRDVIAVLSQSADSDPNLQSRKTQFLETRRPDDGYLHTKLQRPRSPYEIKAGSIIPGVLITGINSDLPGPVVAQVRENVYDSVTGQYLLIPQGARLLASYDSMVVWGQERVLLCWHRLVLPNGDSLDLECMPGADLAGQAGLTDDVDEHWWRIIKGAAIASLLSAATTAAAGNTQGYNPTVPQLWARGAASEVGTAGEHITRRNLMIQPTITIRPGWSMNVMVTRDMILPPYEQAGAVPDLSN